MLQWWQTETGGFCITPLPVAGIKLKPGCAMMPFFGIEPALLNEKGEELVGASAGYLVIKKPWPSTLRSIYGDHKRMEEVYFNRFPGYFMTGDGARRDQDGHYFITGRVDDGMVDSSCSGDKNVPSECGVCSCVRDVFIC